MGLNEDLDQLDRLIRQLQIEWEKFFAGVERRPPNDLQKRVEGLVRTHAYTEMRNMGDRFRYQSLTARFNTFSELWNKRLRAREEGHAVGTHGLKAIMPPELLAAALAPLAVPGSSLGPRPAAGPAGGEVRVRTPTPDDAGVRGLFEQFASARQAAGEPAVKFETFQKLVGQQAQRIIAEKGASAVDFRVESKDGKVSLKARPVK